MAENFLHEQISCSPLVGSFRLELPASHNFDLVLATYWRVLAPRMDRLPSLKVERTFECDLRTKMVNCVLCFHDVRV